MEIASHRRIPVDLVRIFLGVALFVKGVQFYLDPTFVTESLTRGGWFEAVPGVVLYYIVLAHIVGGSLLAIGLLTRISVLVQLPVLLGAAFIVSLPEGPLSYTHRFEFTALVLFLLLMILLHGGGRLSVDHYLKSRAQAA